MRILSINGTYRKGRSIDTLVSKAIEGAKSKNRNVSVDQIHLIDRHIEYCRNCMTCRLSDTEDGVAECIISDDMSELFPLIQAADNFIFASPINCGTVTAVMKTFLERTSWTLAKPGNYPFHGCPEPRSKKKRKAIIVLSAGIAPPELRQECDDATGLIKNNCECMFNAEVTGTLFAGAVENKGLFPYLDDAFKLGVRLV